MPRRPGGDAKSWKRVGLTLLNLAAFFVPGWGELLLAKMLQKRCRRSEGVVRLEQGA
jgi:hypothetical protein